MRISKDYELVFVSTPKSGSHTGWKIMDDNFPISAAGMHNNIVPTYAVNYNAFTFVRNPYDRAVSLWNSLFFAENSCKTKKEITIAQRYRRMFLSYINSDNFDSFCDYLAKKQYHKISNKFYKKFLLTQSEYHSTSNLKYIQPIQLENNNVVDYIFEKTGIKINYIPHELKRDHATWDNLYSNENKENILKWAKEDFKLYGYEI